MATIRAPDPGESVHRVAAIKELPDYPFRDRSQSPEGVLELFLVHAEKRLPVILEESVQRAVRKPPRMIDHDRLGGGRVKGGTGRRDDSCMSGGTLAGITTLRQVSDRTDRTAGTVVTSAATCWGLNRSGIRGIIQ